MGTQNIYQQPTNGQPQGIAPTDRDIQIIVYLRLHSDRETKQFINDKLTMDNEQS